MALTPEQKKLTRSFAGMVSSFTVRRFLQLRRYVECALRLLTKSGYDLLNQRHVFQLQNMRSKGEVCVQS